MMDKEQEKLAMMLAFNLANIPLKKYERRLDWWHGHDEVINFMFIISDINTCIYEMRVFNPYQIIKLSFKYLIASNEEGDYLINHILNGGTLSLRKLYGNVEFSQKGEGWNG